MPQSTVVLILIVPFDLNEMLGQPMVLGCVFVGLP